jgi:hypothetical protein
MRRAATCALVATLTAPSCDARAQANPRSAPIGGRSALMGGTGVALARDGSAPFLNPATILNISDSGLAFSVNFYTFQATDLGSFHQPGAVDMARYGALSLPNASLDSSRADALPSTLCLFLTIGHWGDNADQPEPDTGHRKGRRKLAACFGSLERQVFSATASGYDGDSGNGVHATQAVSIQRSWNRVYVGPSYSVYVTDDVAIGAALDGIGTLASSTWSVDTMVTGARGGTDSSAYDTAMSAYSIDLGAMLGVMWRIDDARKFGASISTPALHLFGRYDGTAALQSSGPGGSASLATSSGGFSAPPPVRLGLGIGSETRRLRLEGDLGAYLPLTDLAHVDVQGAPNPPPVKSQPAVDAALGAEYFLSPGFSILGGASTDFTTLAPLPSSPPIGTLAESRTERVTGSFGIGSYGDGSELLMGFELSYAWGRSIAVDPFVEPTSLALVDQHTWTAMLIVAGSASLSAFRRTLRDLGNAVSFPQSR